MSRSKENDNSDDRVGYGRPPKSSRFKPGQSGNPAGRKRAQPQIVDVLRAILNERVSVQVNGQRTSLRKYELLFRGIVNRAANGEPRAAKQALDLIREYGLLKIEDVQHHVTVELVRSAERGGYMVPEQKLRSKSFPPLKPRKG